MNDQVLYEDVLTDQGSRPEPGWTFIVDQGFWIKKQLESKTIKACIFDPATQALTNQYCDARIIFSKIITEQTDTKAADKEYNVNYNDRFLWELDRRSPNLLILRPSRKVEYFAPTIKIEIDQASVEKIKNQGLKLTFHMDDVMMAMRHAAPVDSNPIITRICDEQPDYGDGFYNSVDVVTQFAHIPVIKESLQELPTSSVANGALVKGGWISKDHYDTGLYFMPNLNGLNGDCHMRAECNQDVFWPLTTQHPSVSNSADISLVFNIIL